MKIKNVLRRALSLALAVLMTISAIPAITTEVSAAGTLNTGITGLSASWTDASNSSGSASWSVSGNSITGTATGYTQYWASRKSVTTKLTFTSEKAASLSFTYSLTGGGSVSANTGTMSGDSYSGNLAAGGSVVITLTSPTGSSTNTLTISNISLASEISVTFGVPTGGSYTASSGGTTIAQGTPYEALPDAQFSLYATPASGYEFFGWYNETSKSYLSYDNNYTTTLSDGAVVYATFKSSTDPLFDVNGKQFFDLNRAITYAVNNNVSRITLVGDGTLPAGNYTIPAGKTLLIPFNGVNDDGTVTSTLYTAEPGNTGYSGMAYINATAIPWTKPTIYKTLTMASGASITVNGAISVSAKHSAAGGTKTGAGSPSQSAGMIKMNSGSKITLNSGSNLYAWGFITGDGEIVANNGSTIYENFQATDFCGGTATTNRATDKKVFPMCQYYVQNIEVLTTYYPGAKEIVYTSIFMTRNAFSASIPFMGEGGMFVAESGYVTKKYDGSKDRLILTMNGVASLSPINMSISTTNINSKDFALPINSNMDIIVKSGTVATLNQSLALLPGSSITVEDGATITISEGTNIFVYDQDEWTYGLTDDSNQTRTTIRSYIHGDGVEDSDGVTGMKAIPYAPGKTYNRQLSDLCDVTVDVNGIVNANGNLYTTAGGANVISSEGTGVINMNSIGTATYTYQAQYESGADVYYRIPVTSAQLKNGDGSYTATTGAAANSTYIYDALTDKWVKLVPEVTITLDGNGGSFSKTSVTTDVNGNATLPPTGTRAGYEFAGWNTAQDGSGISVPANITTATAMTLYAQWTAKTDTPYVVEHYQENIGSDDYTLFETEPKTGTTDTKVKPDVKTYEGFTSPEAQEVTVLGDGSAVVEYEYTRNSYTIVWKDGEDTLQSKTYEYGETITSTPPDDPTKTGYTFAGWDEEIPETMPAGGVTITATWTPHTYTVKFDPNDGGGTEMANLPMTYGIEQSLPANTYAKTGYTFSGWSTDKNATTATYTDKASVNNLTAEANGEVTLYAIWTPIEYTVTWDIDGVTTESKVAYGAAITAPETPTKDGYTFAGWYKGGEEVTFPMNMPPEALTLKAKWTAENYTITYNLDGGTVDGTNTTSYTIESETITLINPTKVGYTFAGWMGTDLTEATEDVTIAKGSTGDREYTATWTANTYTIKFDKNAVDAKGTMDDLSMTYGTAKNLTANAYSRTGYTFSGWSTDKNATTATYTDKTSVNNLTEANGETVTLYAVWTKNSYTIAFYKSDLTLINSTSYNYGAEIDTTSFSSQTSKDGYSFAGWTLTEGSDDAINSVANTVNVDEALIDGFKNGDTINLYPVWTINKYTVTWKSEDGTVLETDENVEYGATPSYDGATPTKAETAQYTYTFSGWSPEIVAVTEKATYTAQFSETVKKYTVTWIVDGEEYHKQTDVEYGTQIELPAAPTKASTVDKVFTFAGWEGYTDGMTVDGDETFTAKFNESARTYTISWDTDGDGDVDDTTNVEYGKTPEHADGVKSSTAEYTYTFKGWSPAIVAVTGDATYTAQFSENANEYTVTWMIDGTEQYTTTTVAYGAAITKPATDPTKTGHAFNGWGSVPETMPAEDITITAKWTVNSYTVTLIVDDEAYDTATVPYGSAIDLSAVTAPTKVGYTFAGWDGVPATMPAEDIGVTAKWNVNKYTVSWHKGSTKLKSEELSFESDIVPYNNLSKIGHTLSWTAKDDNGNVISPVPSKVPAYNVSFYVVWIPNNYTITFNEDGGSDVADITATFESSVLAPANPTKMGYIFDGWYNGDKKVEFPINMPLDGMSLKAKWTPITYTITYDLDGGTATNTTSYTIESEAITLTEPTKTGYTFAGWTGTDLTEATKNVTIAKGSIGNREYTANWTINTYTVTWVDEDGTTVLETDENVEYGATPSYDGATPTKAATAEFTYVFDKWTPEVVAVIGNVTYKATYTATVNKYTVTWINDDGTVLETDENVPYGTTPAYNGETPTKTATAQFTYTHSGWTPEVVAVTGNVTYKATYTATVNKYTVTWINDDGTELEKDENVPYGTVPTYDKETPAKAATAEFTYVFDKWTPEVVAVTGDATYKATYTETVNKYTVTWMDEDGTTVLETDENVPYGTTPAYNGETPTKTATAQYTYTFAGWDKEIAAVTGDATYTAQFGKTPIDYEIIYDYAGGTVATENTTSYNVESDAITLVNPTKTGYNFAGWTGSNGDTAQTTVTIAKGSIGNKSYTATWTPVTYTIGYNLAGGTVATENSTSYTIESEDITLVNPTKLGYTFAGWTGTDLGEAQTTVTIPAGSIGNRTYTATWTVNEYTVTWDVDGVETTETYAYGASITAPADPTKVGYTFKGWSPVVADTMPAENLTYTATWEVNKYTVTWVNGTTPITTTTQDFGLDIAQHANPTKTGHTFVGWAFSADATVADYPVGDVTVDANIVNNANSNNEVVLYAVFSTNSYTVTWNVDGVETEETYAYGATVNAPADPEKTGYTFLGWYDGGVKVEFPTVMHAFDMALTAKWEINKYNITWLVDSNTYDAKTYNHGDTIVAPADPTKDSTVGTVFTFSHWDGFTEGMTATEPKTFVAVFTETVRQYTIGFNADGGSAVESVTDDYNKTITLPDASSSSKTGYTLVGWNDGTKTYNVGGEYTIVGDATLTAVWDANEYTITFVDTGDVAYDTITKDYGEAVGTVADPVKTGYTFAGWDVEIPATMPAENVIITATWTINQYTITFNTDGGSAVAPIELDYGAAIGTVTEPTKTGYTFAGWYVDNNNVDLTTYTVPANDVTVTARWTVNNYTMIWNVDGNATEKTYAYGATIPTADIPVPDKDGFNFGGWTLVNSSEDIYHITTMPAEDITLYPIWTSGYVATFISDGTAVTDYSKAYTTGDTIDKPTLTKEGYTFDGWTVTNTNTDEHITPEPEVMPGYNITFTAKWTPISYTIAFNANGGEGSTAGVTDVNYDANATLTPNGFTREGYTFIGWATSATGEKVYNDEASVKNLTATDNETVTLYAVWQINQYTIIFNTDGGSTVDSITADYGTAVTAPADPTKTGYTFAGWDKEIPATMPAENMTITAQWTVNTYTISFNTDGGSTVADIVKNYDEEIGTVTAPTKTGYTFAGWIITKTGTGEVITAPETIPAYNVTYTAQWTINQYTITFNTDGGSAISPIKLDYGTAIGTVAVPIKTGYTFAGWDKEIPATMPAEDMKITASWTANEYDLVWVYDNGEENDTVKVAYGAEIAEPNAPTKAGHTFAGWYDGDTKVTFPMTMPLNGITLTAKWTINTYTVKWVNANGSVIETDENVPYGTAPTFNGSIPTKAPDAQYTYAFNKWVNAETEADMANVSGDVTYKPTFSTTTNTYTVTWIDGNGNVFFKQENVPYGTVITLPDGTPVKDATVDKVFTFASWGGFTSGMTVDGNEEFTAQFTDSARPYTITWVDGDGETLKTESVAYGEMPEYTGETPAKTATDKYTYTFNGSWSPATTTVTGDATYVAQFDYVVNEYTISWDTDGDGIVDDTTSVAYDEMPAHADGAKAPTAEYTYVFAGWTPAITTVTGNATYKATFTDVPNGYSVIFDVNGGNAVDLIEVAYGSIIDLSAISAAKEGYTFAGWDNVPSTMPANDVTVVAKWSANKYTVKLDANGGIGEEMSSLEKTYDTSLGLTENTYTREGYKFLGWSADKNAMTATYADESILDVDLASESGATVTLYAVWEIQQYTITFVNTGDVTYETITQNYGTAVTAPADPTKIGYTFAGWDREVPATMPAENVTITAQWTINSYSIKWVDGLGNTIKTETLEYKASTSEVTAPTATREGYTFAGWDKEVPATMPAEDVTITATWTINQYTITFADTGDVAYEAITKNYGETVETVADPVKTGHTFAGWDKEVPATMPAEDMTITAQWTVNTYTITFNTDGGSAVADITKNYGEEIGAVTAPTKTGYTFAGWTLDGSAAELPEKMPAENRTYVATWIANTDTAYTVKHWQENLNANGSVYDEVNYTLTDTDERTGTTADEVTPAVKPYAGFTAPATQTVEIAADGSTVVNYYYTRNSYYVAFESNVVNKGEMMQYGATIVAPTAVPTKESTVSTVYTFKNWVDETDETKVLESGVTTVSGTVTYVPAFTESPREYTITWVDGNNNVLGTDSVAYGTTPVYDEDVHGEPTKTATDKYSYAFNGTWSPEIAPVEGTATYTAQFTETVNKYTVTWVDEDGTTVLDTQEVAYDETPVYGGTAPTKADTAEYKYEFDCWTPAITVVKGEATYKATYTATPVDYKVTWISDGETYKETIETFDTVVEKPNDPAKEGHTFNGWKLADADGNAIGEIIDFVNAAPTMPATDVKYIAVWTVDEYTISFNTDGGSAVADITKNYGEEIGTVTAPTKVGYTFAGWTLDGSAADLPEKMPAENRTYVATWAANTDTEYTVVHWFQKLGVYSNEKNESNFVAEVTETLKGTTGGEISAQGTFTGFTAMPDTTNYTIAADGSTVVNYYYIRNFYNVVFAVDGVTVQSGSMQYGASIVAPNDPTKESTVSTVYTFKNWVDETDETKVLESGVTTVSGTVTYVPVFTESPREYTITWVDGNNNVLGTDIVAYGQTPAYDKTVHGEPTKTATKQYTYTFNNTWSPAIIAVVGNATYTAQFDSEVNEYTITWVDEDGTTVLDTQEVAYGETPVYGGVTPAKSADAQYTYTFTGWVDMNGRPVTTVAGDATYKAVYGKTVNSYTVIWENYDGTVLETDNSVSYGATPHFDRVNPTKPATDKYTYTFVGWTPEISAVEGDVTYTAVFTETVNKYQISWLNEDGSVIYTEEVEYDATPSYTGETPVKDATAEFTYVHSGWTPEITTVTGDATYKAAYTAIRNSYTVNWVNDNGVPLDADTVLYGDIPTYDGLTPEKAADVQYTYTFAGWDKDIVAVTGDVTYTATYDKTVNKYKITWVVEGVETVKEVEYGTVPMYGETLDVKPSKNNTAEYFYSFKGWTPAVIAVVGDATYTAEFDPIPVNYTITFNTDGGTAISPITIGFGLDVPDVSDPTKTGYTFIGWDKEIPETMPAENVTITALWQINQYTITFDSNEGSAVDPITQDYDSVVNAPVVPTRYGYDFNGWYLDGAKAEFPMSMPAEDLAFKAEWTVTTYTITWVDGNGNTIDTDTINHGSTPAYVGNVPVKDTDAQYNYTFNGKWSPEIVPAVGNATYTAQFDKTLREYRIGWDINGDGIEDDATYVSYGTVPTHTDGVKAPDEQYEYRFIGWSPELGAVTGVAAYTAMFEPVPVEYTITLDPDGGEFADGSTETMEITAGYGTAITEPENPTKTGYHFLYWMDTEGNESFVPDTMPVGGSILKAKWAVNSYTITFVTGDGATVVAPITDYYGYPIIAPADPAREGYTFAGWDTAVPATMPAGDMVITAKWTVNQYTISFVDADGTPISSNTLDYNAEIGIVADPVKAGYDFIGWVDEFGTQAIIPANMPAYDLTYTATWTPKQFMVAYYADGELVSMEYVYCGSELVSPATEPTKTGYTFAGWVISGTNEAMPETMPASDLILEASWSVGLYTLTYTDGVGNTIYTAQVEYGATITPPAVPTREGYTFSRWSSNRTTMPARNLTINAQWTVNVYTITFVDASGAVIDTVTRAYGQSVTAPAAPAKNGYTFAGWVPAVPETMPVNGAVITATYTANEYRIVFNTNGGSAVADIVALCDEPIAAPADPVRDGYIFIGWDQAIPATMPAGGLTLNAQWTPSHYAINWDTDGDGVVDDTTTVAVGETPVHADGVKPATAEYTYVFEGWTPEISPVTGTVTYTATFTSEPNNYTLAFDTDGGSAVESLTVAYGSAIDLGAVAAPTKEGYTFIGWSTAPETMPAQNVTLVAQWKANEYTITLETAGGTAVAPIIVEFGNRISKPVDPERVGYTFAGWSVDGITAVEFPETMPAGGLSLKALWTVKQFTITYVVDDDAEYVKYTVDFGAAVTQPTDPVKADYTFIGWSPAVPATMPANDVTVVAQWKVNEYTITFDADGGSEVASITAGYGYNISEPNAPTKEGYAFTGWSVDGINAIEFPETMPSGGLNLKALWTVMQYTITFDTADGTAVAPITVNYGDEITKPVDPTRTGYTFAGWSVDGTTAVEFPETMPAGGLSLKALWTVKQFTITYVVDDNAEYAKYTIDFGAAVTQPADPTKADYTFIGWSPAVPATMPALNITVTAQFRYSYTGWKTTASGTTYYVDGEMEYISTWQTIEDKDYYFDENGYVVKGMAQVPAKDGTRISKFIFDETTGAFAADYSGLYDHGADTYMAENGEIKNTEGLVRIVKPDGEVNYYYFVSGKAVKGTTASVEKTNGLLLPTNNYVFDEFGVILHDEDTSKNGKITEADGVTYYYVDGVKAYMGLVFDGEYYYYFNNEGVMVADGKYEVIRTNDLLPADTYRFDKQGRLTFVLRGDLDDDGDVDKNDAIYCLYSVLFGEVRYPLNQDADFNGDGSLDKNDAIYLLYHALFGEARYPLD